MTIDVPSEYEPILAQAVTAGIYSSKEEAIRHALELFATEQQKRLSDLAAIQEGLAEADAGLGRPLAEFVDEIRLERGIATDEAS